MAAAALEYELEALPELEASHEAHETHEWEGESESEQFFDTLRKLAGRATGWLGRQVTTQGSPLRRAAFGAAHSVLQSAPTIYGGIGTGLGGIAGGLAGEGVGAVPGAALGGALGTGYGALLKGLLDPLIPQQEYEAESEWEMEGEISPVRKWYADAMLEHLGHAAAAAESETEAEALVGAMIPLAVRAVPGSARVLARSAPGLICGALSAVRKLRQSPDTRPLVRLVPTIVRRTAATLAQQAAQGTPVKPQVAVRTLARQTARVLGNPQQAAQAFRRSQRLDSQFHNAAARQVNHRCQRCGAKVR